MDYLVSEGYPGAAEKFAQETSLCLPGDIEGIRERVRIRNAIHAGRIDEAIDMVNAMDSEVRAIPRLSSFEMITPSYHAPLIFTRFWWVLMKYNSHFSPQYDPSHIPILVTYKLCHQHDIELTVA
jgi:hypothetical protein